jgi:uncharacterized membrane protein
MRNALVTIPIMTLATNLVIFLNLPILREIVVFFFLSFIPGFAFLKLLKLRHVSHLETILFSVGLSIAFVMLIGLIVNALYPFLLQPLSSAPLAAAMSAFTLICFIVSFRGDSFGKIKLDLNFKNTIKNKFFFPLILLFLPVISALGAIYSNIYLTLFSCVIIAALCLISATSKGLIPESLFPFLIYSISLALICQIPLISRYIFGWDANTEYYVFRTTQITGH